MPRQLQILCVSVGTALVLCALGAPTIKEQSPPSTHHNQATAASSLKPIDFSLLPRKHKARQDDNTKVDYYVSPCLIPLPEIREITNKPLLFESKQQGEGLTSNVADARVSSGAPAFDFPLCTLTTDVNSVKLEFGVGVTHETKDQFKARKQPRSIPGQFGTREISLRGFPNTTAARLTYGYRSSTDRQRAYSSLSVHTRSGYSIFVIYSTTRKDELRRLAIAALRTLDGSRYGIDK